MVIAVQFGDSHLEIKMLHFKIDQVIITGYYLLCNSQQSKPCRCNCHQGKQVLVESKICCNQGKVPAY